jgi:4-hydroxyphenylpyruvate dioxygenase
VVFAAIVPGREGRLVTTLALHTWTLDTTPLDRVLAIARRTGWDAVELRRVDFARAAEAGQSEAHVLDLVRASALPVSCVGAQHGWMFAEDEEHRMLLEVVATACRRAAALGSGLVMSPVDPGTGPVVRAVDSLREVGDVASAHGVRLALEFNSQAAQLNTLARVREVLARAGHPACGLLLDTYHLGRSGARRQDLDDVRPEEIAYVQFSDVPASGLEPGKVLDRLPPGRGIVPFREWFALLAAKGYRGPMSYEAPNAEAWTRPPDEVAREALEATRALLPA